MGPLGSDGIRGKVVSGQNEKPNPMNIYFDIKYCVLCSTLVLCQGERCSCISSLFSIKVVKQFKLISRDLKGPWERPEREVRRVTEGSPD